jgi:predicted Zn finger-like uncharacterized protein
VSKQRPHCLLGAQAKLPKTSSVETCAQHSSLMALWRLVFVDLRLSAQAIRTRVHRMEADMPHVGPVWEGRTFFCPHCGAMYSVTHSQLAKSESSTAKCVVCLKIMDR